MQADNVRRAAVFRELSRQDCLDRLHRSGVGRVAVCTSDGPIIIPVNFVMDDEAVVVRTAPYTILAGHAWGQVAFEVDDLDHDMCRGWSVLVVGQGSAVEDPAEIADSQLLTALTPWAPGSRNMFIKITPQRVTGREVAL